MAARFEKTLVTNYLLHGQLVSYLVSLSLGQDKGTGVVWCNPVSLYVLQ